MHTCAAYVCMHADMEKEGPLVGALDLGTNSSRFLVRATDMQKIIISSLQLLVRFSQSAEYVTASH